MRDFLHGLWSFIVLITLFIFAWKEPWTQALPLGSLFIIPKAFIMGEVLGYVYHRYVQHIGVSTYLHPWIRKNQKSHWEHHMIVYPVGKRYKRSKTYATVEKKMASWMYPIIGIAGFFFLTMGFTLSTLLFVALLLIYYHLSVEVTHSRFHIYEHPWKDSIYFQWLNKVHRMHHWHHDKNFTILHPLMDMLCGTYLAPSQEILDKAENDDTYDSDVYNWNILLQTPYAKSISCIEHQPRFTAFLKKMKQKMDASTLTHIEEILKKLSTAHKPSRISMCAVHQQKEWST